MSIVCNILTIGCFDPEMRKMGYGICLENGKRHSSGIEEIPMRKIWKIREGTLQPDGVYVVCNTHSLVYSHWSSKHYFNQGERYINQKFLSESQNKYLRVTNELEDREVVTFGVFNTEIEQKRILRE